MEIPEIKKLLEGVKLVQRLIDERQTEARNMLAMGDAAESGVLLEESRLLMVVMDVAITRSSEEIKRHER